jgi:hypothetical protein
VFDDVAGNIYQAPCDGVVPLTRAEFEMMIPNRWGLADTVPSMSSDTFESLLLELCGLRMTWLSGEQYYAALNFRPGFLINWL